MEAELRMGMDTDMDTSWAYPHEIFTRADLYYLLKTASNEICLSCLKIDASSEPRVELDLQLFHLLSDCMKIFFKFGHFVIDLCC
jgi:hypothetical protein